MEDIIAICVVSDTHNDVENINKLISVISDKETLQKVPINADKIDVVVHLGDECEDAEIFRENRFNVISVPGVFCQHYRDRAVPHRIVKEIGGVEFLLTHTKTAHPNDFPDDIKPEEVIQKKLVDVILYGHTHVPAIEKINDVILFNPGHLKSTDKRGYSPSFGIIEVVDKSTVEMKIVELSSLNVFIAEKFKIVK
jgi:putative phosphoesterase